MFRTIKILLATTLFLSAVWGYMWYQTEKEHLFEEARSRIEAYLSGSLGREVTIEKLKFTPLCSAVLKGMTIKSPENPSGNIKIQVIKITPNVFSAVKDRRLVLDISIGGLTADGLSSDISVTTTSRASGTWKGLFDPHLVNSVTVKNGWITWNGHHFRDIYGVTDIKDLLVNNGKIAFTYGSHRFSVDFERDSDTNGAYRFTLRSAEYYLSGTLSADRNTLVAHDFKGTLLNMRMDLKGTIRNLTVPGGRQFSLEGNIDGDVLDALDILMSSDSLGKIPDITGSFEASVRADFTENDLRRMTLDARIRSESTGIGRITLENVSAGLTYKEGYLDIPDIMFSINGTRVSAAFTLDSEDETLPLALTLSGGALDLSELTASPDSSAAIDYGKMDVDLSLKGPGRYLTDIFRPQGKETASTAAVKFLKNIDMETTVRLSHLRTETVDIEDITASITSHEGRFSVSPFSLDVLKGTVTGSVFLDLNDNRSPLTLDTAISHIEPWNRATGSGTGTTALVEGNMDLNLHLKTYAADLLAMKDHIRNVPDDKGEMSALTKTVRCLEFLMDEKDTTGYELNADLSSRSLSIGKVRLEDISGKAVLSGRELVIPPATAKFYGGQAVTGLVLDIDKGKTPFAFNLNVSGSDFGSLVRNSMDPKSEVTGTLDGYLNLDGDIRDQRSYTGIAEINITGADLGPMPLLTPLLGEIYATMEKIFPAFREVQITSASATFDIKDRKLMTDDLLMSGDDIEIAAQGYMDFDGRLNVAFENRLIMPETEADDNWPVAIRNFITGFGRLISKAYLKGTIRKPQWEFEYINHIADSIGRNVKAFFRNIMD